eukprot:TRINITY_DN70490_c0_g1_i1.p1 TRINITY_DN70490_c0_g1~~TRINITY_DN70490_c0_g1_i1.p1  ORF type:complete len:196 (-),score=5.46 TRINITY_DN70490_c0_g1_i1:147-734(-)
MLSIRNEHRPEVFERGIFPFNPSRPPSPAEKRLSIAALSRKRDRGMKAAGGPRQHALTLQGVELTAETGPLLQPSNPNLPRWTPRSSSVRGSPRGGESGAHSVRGSPGGGERGCLSARGTPRGAEANVTLPSHRYAPGHSFGIHDVRNDVNPFLAHYQIPKWTKTSECYGAHTKHAEQTYSRGQRNRMPVFQINL